MPDPSASSGSPQPFDPSTGSESSRAESRGEWVEQVRPRLAVLRLHPARETEIVEELSQHLDQRYDELRR
jgi:hypothetical protein